MEVEREYVPIIQGTVAVVANKDSTHIYTKLWMFNVAVVALFFSFMDSGFGLRRPLVDILWPHHQCLHSLGSGTGVSDRLNLIALDIIPGSAVLWIFVH